MANRSTTARHAAKALGTVPEQLAALHGLTIGQLSAKYRELFGEPTRSRNKGFLLKKVAWKLQAQAEGDLTPRTLARIAELGDALPERWRTKPPAAPSPAAAEPPRDPRLPPAGTVLRRVHGSATHEVTVGADSFEYAGQTFGSLSAVAKKIAGCQVNGFAFFGLKSAASATGGAP